MGQKIGTALAGGIALLLTAFFAFVGWHKLVSSMADLARFHSWTAFIPETLGRLVGVSELVCAALLLCAFWPAQRRLARVAAVVLIVNQVIAALVHWQQGESSALPQNVVLVAMLLVPALFLKNTQEKNG